MNAPLEVKTRHWVFSDGTREPIAASVVYPSGYRKSPPTGWYCWAYPNDDDLFVEWMARMCPSADVCHRFNSGDPMFTVYFPSTQEALLFHSTWTKIYSPPVL